MKLIRANDTEFKDKTYVFELTGEELVRLWHISRAAEGGSSHKIMGRFHDSLESIFRDVNFKELAKKLDFGVLS